MDREAWWTTVYGVIIKESEEVRKMSSAYPPNFTVRKLNQSLINSTKVTWLEDSKAEILIPFFEYSNAFSTRLLLFFSYSRNYSLSNLKCRSVFCWLLKCFFCFRLNWSKRSLLFFSHPFQNTLSGLHTVQFSRNYTLSLI